MPFEKLKAYQAALRLRREIDLLHGELQPGSQSLFEQISRAADSILLNLAEGSDSVYPAKRVLSYDIARNSANEVWSALKLADQKRAFGAAKTAKARTMAFTVRKLIAALIQEARTRT